MEDQLSSIIMFAGTCLVTVLLLASSICDDDEED
jgi:hypothetical protein